MYISLSLSLSLDGAMWWWASCNSPIHLQRGLHPEIRQGFRTSAACGREEMTRAGALGIRHTSGLGY